VKQMKYQQYKLKYYLNCRHAIYINGELGEIHPHTWEIVTYLAMVKEGFVPFNDIEKVIDELLDQYQDQVINEKNPFDVINPTLENCAHYFREIIAERLNKMGWIMLMMEISETPSRSYVMSMIDEQKLGRTQTINTLTDLIIEDVKKAPL